MTGLAGATETHERDGKHSFSYQSLIPAGAGTPRYENWVHWLMEGSGVVCAAHPAPSWGQAPALHFSLATLGCRCLGDGGWCRRPAPELIPDRSPGHAFVPIAHAGCRRHTKV